MSSLSALPVDAASLTDGTDLMASLSVLPTDTATVADASTAVRFTPALLPYSRTAASVQAIQFDGRISTLLAIYQAAMAAPVAVAVTINFDPQAVAQSVSFAGGATFSFRVGDWVVFPPGGPIFTVADDEFSKNWQ
jgi:hypothetical protein